MSILQRNHSVANGHFQEVEEQNVQSVCIQRLNGIPVSCDITKLKTREIMKMLLVYITYQEIRPVQGGVHKSYGGIGFLQGEEPYSARS
jgi:hypothetical protein